MRYVYLHGFASSPASRKARLFIGKLAANGVQLEAPDLAPDFEHLTITSQLAVIEHALQGAPAVLIGSSMGGYLAAIYASLHPEINRLVLMAPAFDFYQLWSKELGPVRLDDWRKNGTVSVFHYGRGHEAALNYQLMTDAHQHPPYPDFVQPCLVLHGVRDAVVPYDNSVRFASSRPNVTLLSFDSGHELTDVLDEIWKSASTFLLGPNAKVR